MSILGNRVVRREDPKLLTTGGTYVGDIDLGTCLYAYFVTATVAHGAISEIDVAAARESEGVVAIYTWGDLDLSDPVPMFKNRPSMVKEYLARDFVRYVGEPVALVVADSAAAATDAAEMILVDYDVKDAVVDIEAAFGDSTLLYPLEGTNVATSLGAEFSDDFFSDADVVVSQRIVNQRLAPVPLEVRACAARPTDDGRLEVYASTQTPHAVKAAVAAALGLDPSNIHVITPDVGGGFGAKAAQYSEEMLVAWAAKKLDRPVMWVETRSQNLTGLGHGRAQVQYAELGAKSDGTVVGYRLRVIQDGGAYPMVGCYLPMLTMKMATGVYKIPKFEFTSSSVVTNTTPIVSYRGAGRPEATAAIERMMDLLAKELSMDPAEIRSLNLIAKESFPYKTAAGATYDVGDYQRVLSDVLAAASYESIRKEQAERRCRGDVVQLGIGISVYVEVTNPFPSKEFGAVAVSSEGRVMVRSGTSPQGQGHATSWAMLASDVLGIPMETIDVVTGDTDLVPRGIGTFGSRSLQLGGVAIHQASTEVLERAKSIAAEMLEASLDDIVVSDGARGLGVAGTPSVSVSWAELATHAEGSGEPLIAEVDFSADDSTYPFGAHLVVVEVDTETGKVQVQRVVAMDDAGRIIAPLLAEGQVHGGLAQGIAQALMEEMVYDSAGNPLTSNLADYGFISAAELPSFEILHNETPTFLNPLGVKGIGESGTIGSSPAVQNAVIDALAHLGVTHIDMPTSPKKVWEALAEVRRS